MAKTGELQTREAGIAILIVEDSPTQAERLRSLLAENGYDVAVAADAAAALAAARHRVPALVISDILMPGMDGYALCKAVKSDAGLKETPVVLLTSLSSSLDVVKGLECGADNFIRKPYDAAYLLSRIRHVLANRELRKTQRMQMGIEIELGGQRHFITSERQQILDLLLSTYEQAVHVNDELLAREQDLARSEQIVKGVYRIAEGLNQATSEREVVETTLERALELPGMRAGWISLREGEAGFRIAAARGLPPALAAPGVFEGDCLCRRLCLSGGLGHVTNIHECERLKNARGDTEGLRYHASVPLWTAGQMLGVLNLAGPDQGLFSDGDLEVLYGVGTQVGVALERARLLAELEQKNRDLEGVNKELEAFSYSVSHDLRAPLRSIDGFSQALLKDDADRLDDDGKRHLRHVCESARQMAELIDGLLALSRVTRSELRWDRVDLSQLGRGVAGRLKDRAAESGRRVDFVVEDGMSAEGDARLLALVLENLLGNAWKFTSKRSSGRIEFGQSLQDGRPAFFVRDNGAGFDMAYAGKLFGAFQRLHAASEFEGHGIGLATVQRIVRRHGGRVWAEAEVDRGATVYFTLEEGHT